MNRVVATIKSASSSLHVCRIILRARPAGGSRTFRIGWAACRQTYRRAAHARNELMRSALRKPLGRRDWQQAK
jgi:hypothetical protein